MSTYRLDETPDTYISAVIEEGSYTFRMYSIRGDSTTNHLRDIDLRKDKLIIYGTQIQDSVREKLHNSLLLRSTRGRIFVDCNGSCYIYVAGTNAFYRPIQQVIFDWFSFGGVVPNSVYHVMSKQRDEELATLSSQLRRAKDEAAANKDGWEASKMEMDKVILQLSGCRKERLDKETELESMMMKFEKVENELYSSNMELELSMIRLDCSNKRVIELEEQVKSGEKVQDQLSLIVNELQSIKVFQLEEQGKSGEKVQDQLSLIVNDLQSIKVLLDFTTEMKEDRCSYGECCFINKSIEIVDEQ